MRKSRFFDQSTFDDPEQELEAGSTTEFDMLGDWGTSEIIEELQTTDGKLAKAEQLLVRCRDLLDSNVHCKRMADFEGRVDWYRKKDPLLNELFEFTNEIETQREEE